MSTATKDNPTTEPVVNTPDLNPAHENPSIIDVSESYKRLGFFTAIHEKGNKYYLDSLIAENEYNTRLKIQALEDRYTPRIRWLNAQLSTLERRLANETGNKEILQKLEETRQKLVHAYVRLGEAKRKLIESRLDDFKQEIGKFFQVQENIYMDWRKIHLKIFQDNKPGIDVLKARAVQLRDQFNERYKEVEEQLVVMDRGGVDTLAFKYLLSGGVSLVAGWFFSVYLLIENNLSSGIGQQDVWFFTFNSILLALSSNPFIAFAQVVFFIAVIGITAFFSYTALFRLDKNKNSQDFGFNFEKDSGLELADGSEPRKGFSIQVKSDSFYAFWLSAAPILMTLGLVFIIFRMANAAADQTVDRLDISMAGQFIGTILAYAAASLFYLFIAKITDFKHLRYWNYVATAGVFLIPALFYFNLPNKQLAVTGFIYSLLLSAIPVAMGIRYRGLRRVGEYLNQGLGYFNSKIAEYSTPPPVHIFSDKFEEEALQMQEELLSSIRGKNQGVRDMLDAPIQEKKEEKKAKIFTRFWKDFVASLGFYSSAKENPVEDTELQNVAPKASENSNNASHSISGTTPVNPEVIKIYNLELDEFERNNFPDHEKEIAALKYQYDEIRTRQRDATTETIALEQEIDEIVKKIFDLKSNRIESVNRLSIENMVRKTWIMEGFELGLWYLHNNIFEEMPDKLPYDFPPKGRPTPTDFYWDMPPASSAYEERIDGEPDDDNSELDDEEENNNHK